MIPFVEITTYHEFDSDGDLHVGVYAELVGTDKRGMIVIPGAILANVIKILQQTIEKYPEKTIQLQGTVLEAVGEENVNKMKLAFAREMDDAASGKERKPS